MSTASLSLVSLTTPIDVTTAESATVNYSLDSGAQTVSFIVTATPVGGGSPIVVGQSGGFSGAGGGQTTFDLTNISALDPSQDYVFSVESSDGVVGGNPIGPIDVACFAEGTLILTERGEVPVEQLRVGDLAMTMHGGTAPLRPILWIGHTRLDIARHPDPAKAAPIVVSAGALGNGMPRRDLRLSPEHALFLDGLLVPVNLLVNGTTIVQEAWCQTVTYWHVELPTHGLLVSEGVVSESYFDDGNRQLFDNRGATVLVKDFVTARQSGRYDDTACAPVLRGGVALDRLRARIAERAEAMMDGRRTAA
ncbi:Hint domain-containing protein [Neoroseomonas lacus]|uniref:Hedgehog/Intein (Hint) domain-containing protein n=1 Tax=Neoroseomonas lacus TaxID=287609 RepID=A0A917NIP7_9PROT|nr:Hint domain-containing protein [Neoroseomonas lacus]GGJ03800.1 hypothetical protein GCM10011320_08520 [Neoroseomonas lacus]